MRTPLILLALVSVAERAHAQIELPDPLSGKYVVDPKGKGPRTFTKLSTAVRYISLVGVAGPTEVHVAPGEYEGALMFFPVPGLKDDQQVVLKGMGQGEVRVKAEGSIVVFTEGVSNVVLDGFTFGESGTRPAVVAGAKVGDIEIRNCRFTKETGGNRVIEIQGRPKSSNWNIHHNKFELGSGSGYGIYTQATYKLDIHHNEFVCNDLREPISLWNANKSESKVRNNVFRGSVSGCAMRLDVSGHDVQVFNNLFYLELRNGSDAVIRSQGLRNNRHNRILHNVFIVRGQGHAVRTRGPIGLDHNLYAIEEGGICQTNNTSHETLKDWQAAVAEGFAVDNEADQNSATAGPKFFDRHEKLLGLFHRFEEEDEESEKPKEGAERTDPKQAVRFLIGVLGGDDPVAIRLAVRRLRTHGRAAIAAVPALGKLCGHAHAAVRADVAEALGEIRIGAEIVIPELVKMLSEKDERVLLAVLRTLARFEHLAAEAAPKIEALEKHDLASVKAAATAARKAVRK